MIDITARSQDMSSTMLRTALPTIASVVSLIMGFITILDILWPPSTVMYPLVLSSDIFVVLIASIVGLGVTKVNVKYTNLAAFVLLITLLLSINASSYVGIDSAPAGYLVLLITAASFIFVNHKWFTISMLACLLTYVSIAQEMEIWRTWTPLIVTAFISALLLHHIRVKSHQKMIQSWEKEHADALHDTLTGLLNRKGLEENVKTLFQSLNGTSSTLNVTFIDIDGLKTVNDTYNHEAGDAVLKAVGAAIAKCIRTNDIAARWGGDEFVLITVGEDFDEKKFEERVVNTVRNDSQLDQQCWEPSLTAGLSKVICHDYVELDFPTLLDQADSHMYTKRYRRRNDKPAIGPSIPNQPSF